ncbi:hypothetical protein V6N13_024519 [Hibiscus sabdariffa]
MDLAQLGQVMDDASDDSITEEETLKEVNKDKQLEPLELVDTRIDVLKQSIEEPSKLELKPFPEHLK